MTMNLNMQIVPNDFPELARLVWNGDPARPITPQEAFNLYENNWRFVEPAKMCRAEKTLVAELAKKFGHGVLLTA
jgi:hypothetical protein